MKKNIIYLLLSIILVVSFTIFMLNRDHNINEELKVEIAPIPEKTVELVTLYFPNRGKQYLVKEKRVIEHTVEQPEKLILEELIKGPANEKNDYVIPPNAKIYSIVIKNDTAYVNLSNEFKSDMKLGSNNEMLAIYSIVNSLTELRAIKNVRLIVEGEEQGVLQKYMPLDHLYKQNLKLVNHPIRNPIEVVKDYFSFIEKEEYRQAFDLLYNPASVNIDYSMYYHYQKERNIKKRNIYTYKMREDNDFRVVTFNYSETNSNGDKFTYNKDFKLKNDYGYWKIVIENLP